METDCHNEALQVLTRATSESFGAKHYSLNLQAATLYRQLKKFAEAERHYRICVEVNPGVS